MRDVSSLSYWCDILNLISKVPLCIFFRLPDDDRDICFFDYYVDESGEWDPWQSRYSNVPDIRQDIYSAPIILIVDVRIKLWAPGHCSVFEQTDLTNKRSSHFY